MAPASYSPKLKTIPEQNKIPGGTLDMGTAFNYSGISATDDSSTPELVPKTRSFGVRYAPNHCAETQLEGDIEVFNRIFNTYNRSPLALREKPLDLSTIARKYVGTHGDRLEVMLGHK